MKIQISFDSRKKEIFSGIENPETFFLPLERQRLVLYLLESVSVPSNNNSEPLNLSRGQYSLLTQSLPNFGDQITSDHFESNNAFDMKYIFGKYVKYFYAKTPLSMISL